MLSAGSGHCTGWLDKFQYSILNFSSCDGPVPTGSALYEMRFFYILNVLPVLATINQHLVLLGSDLNYYLICYY